MWFQRKKKKKDATHTYSGRTEKQNEEVITEVSEQRKTGYNDKKKRQSEFLDMS